MQCLLFVGNTRKRAMKHLLIILMSLSSLALAESRFDEGCFSASQISLTIKGVSGEKVSYYYRQKSEFGECLIEVRESRNGKESVKVKRYAVEENSNIPKLFSKSLDFDLRDSISLHDGSLWTLNSYLYQNFSIKISTPEYRTEERGYNRLLEFRSFLKKEIASTDDS